MVFQDPDQRLPLYQVDAFTDEMFGGNPAAVCVLPLWYPDDLLQKIAAEMNLSETAFVVMDDLEQSDGPSPIRLRWFTPKAEVPLCGHATLATSSVLFWRLEYPYELITYDTLSGELTAKLVDDRIQLDLPVDEPVPVDPPVELMAAMGITAFEDVAYAPKGKDLLVRVATWQEVAKVEPNFTAMVAAPTDTEVTGVIVTSVGTPNEDFVSRFFAPWWGVNEDPVTGAAHTILGPYWSKVLGKDRMVARQISERQGDMIVEVTDGGRVLLKGDASLVMVGEIRI